jgi:hypothetical protein
VVVVAGHRVELESTVVAPDGAIAVSSGHLRDFRRIFVAEYGVDLVGGLVWINVVVVRMSRLLLGWSGLVLVVRTVTLHVATVLVEGLLTAEDCLAPAARNGHVGGSGRRDDLLAPEWRLLVIDEDEARDEALSAVVAREGKCAVAVLGLVELERVRIVEVPAAHAADLSLGAAVRMIEGVVAQLAIGVEGIAADAAVITRRGDPRGSLLGLVAVADHH